MNSNGLVASPMMFIVPRMRELAIVLSVLLGRRERRVIQTRFSHKYNFDKGGMELRTLTRITATAKLRMCAKDLA